MPMHDWARVVPGIYHDFRNLWLVAIRHALNNGLLPDGFYALSEQKLGPFELDVLALDPVPKPVGAAGGAGNPRPEPAVGVLERAERAARQPRRSSRSPSANRSRTSRCT